MDDRIRNVIAQYAKVNADVDELDEYADLYQAGMTSHASIGLMLGLENEFDIEFPDQMLTRGTFESIASIRRGVTELTTEAAA